MVDNQLKAIADAIVDYSNGIAYDKVLEKLTKSYNTATLKVWREDENIPLPAYGKEGDACCDVYAKSIKYESDKDRYVIHTGLHFALPDNYEMELRPRSSNTKTDFYIPNTPMTLDWGYRGELLVIFKCRTDIAIINTFDEILSCLIANRHKIDTKDFVNAATKSLRKFEDEFPYKPKERICQLLIRRRVNINFEEVQTLEELGSTERGEGGFGSTGK